MVDLDLACITCRSSLTTRGAVLVCPACNTQYPVRDGVPCLLPESPTIQQQEQMEYFDAEFAGYARYEPERWRLSFVERIVQALEIDSGREPNLDVGVGGSGATVIEAARRGVSSVGCDLSVQGVIAARRFAELAGARPAQFVACAAESLPFIDGAFGCARSVPVLEHLDEDDRAARELARVLRPGGLLWITVPSAY